MKINFKWADKIPPDSESKDESEVLPFIQIENEVK